MYQVFVYPALSDKMGIITAQHVSGILASFLFITIPNITYFSLDEGLLMVILAIMIAHLMCFLITVSLGVRGPLCWDSQTRGEGPSRAVRAALSPYISHISLFVSSRCREKDEHLLRGILIGSSRVVHEKYLVDTLQFQPFSLAWAQEYNLGWVGTCCGGG